MDGGRWRESLVIPNKPIVSSHYSYHTNQNINLWNRTNYLIQLDDTQTHTHTCARKGYAILIQRYTTNSTQHPWSHTCLCLCIKYNTNKHNKMCEI